MKVKVCGIASDKGLRGSNWEKLFGKGETNISPRTGNKQTKTTKKSRIKPNQERQQASRKA